MGMNDDHFHVSGRSGERDPLVEFGRWLQRHPRYVARIIFGAALVALVAWGLLGSFYTVDVQENAIILRFGKYLKSAGTVGPGLHGKIPFGIDRVYKARVKEVKKEEFGYKTLRAGVESEYQVIASLMLTGDLNVVNLRWVVRYKIDNLPDYLFNLRSVRVAVRDVANAVMRQVVGDYSVDEALTIGRQDIQIAAQEQMQELLDQYRAGIHIVAVRLQESTPPDEVRDAFNEVNRALQEKQKMIQQAKGERNRRIPAARGARERVILEAEGYKIEKVNIAQGDAGQFESVRKRYEVAREITRQRLYLETMARILPKAGKKYVVQGGGDVLKLLPLDTLPARKGGAQ